MAWAGRRTAPTVVRMKHVTYAHKALLVDDEAADWLMEYARALGEAHMTDSVTVRGIGMDGNEVESTFLLNASTELVTQTANTSAEGPDNDEAIGYMQERTRLILAPPAVQPIEDPADAP